MFGYWKWLYKVSKMTIKWLFTKHNIKCDVQIQGFIFDAIIVTVIWATTFLIIGFPLTGYLILAFVTALLISGHMIYLEA